MMIMWLVFLALTAWADDVQLAYAVADVKTGTTIAKSGETWWQPASVNKIFLLRVLADDLQRNPEYVFAQLWQGDELHVFQNDPMLTSEDLLNWAQKLRMQGIKQLRKPIHVHMPLYRAQRPGILWQERFECYSLSPETNGVDYACRTQRVAKDDHQVMIDGQPWQVERHAMASCPRNTGYPADAFLFDQQRKVWLWPQMKKVIVCSDVHTDFNMRLTVGDQVDYFQTQLLAALEAAGIAHLGVAMHWFDTQPPSAAQVISGHDLASIVREVMSHSNNYLAQWLMLGRNQTLSAYVQDGSGLSRYNWLKREELLDYLLGLVHQSPALLQYLPMDGYWSHAITWPKGVHMRYKTGSLAHLRNMAVVFYDRHQPRYVAVFHCVHPGAMTEGACKQVMTQFLQKWANLAQPSRWARLKKKLGLFTTAEAVAVETK